MSASTTLGTAPTPKQSPGYADQLVLDFFDLLSPSPWILEAMEALKLPDLRETVVKPFVGDYGKVSTHAAGYATIGTALVELADELDNRLKNMTSEGVWEGHAATNFSTHMDETSKEIRVLGTEAQEAGRSFDTAARMLHDQYLLVSEIVLPIFDGVCDVASFFFNPAKAIEGIAEAVHEWPKVQRLLAWFDGLPETIAAFKSLLKTGIATAAKIEAFADFADRAEDASKAIGMAVGTDGMILGNRFDGDALGAGSLKLAELGAKFGDNVVSWANAGEGMLEFGSEASPELSAARAKWWDESGKNWGKALEPYEMFNKLPDAEKLNLPAHREDHSASHGRPNATIPGFPPSTTGAMPAFGIPGAQAGREMEVPW